MYHILIQLLYGITIFQVLLLGIDELTSIRNVELLKRELRVSLVRVLLLISCSVFSVAINSKC